MKKITPFLLVLLLSGCGVQVTQEVSVENEDGEMEVVSSEEISLSEAMKSLSPILNLNSFEIGDQSVSRAGGNKRDPDIFVEVKKGWVPKEKLSPKERLDALKERVHFYELCIGHGIDLESRITKTYERKTLLEILGDLVPAIDVEFLDYDKHSKIEQLVIKDARLEHVLLHVDDAAKARFEFRDSKLYITKE